MPEDMMIDGMIMNSKPSSETENHIEQIDLITSEHRTDQGNDTNEEPYPGRETQLEIEISTNGQVSHRRRRKSSGESDRELLIINSTGKMKGIEERIPSFQKYAYSTRAD